MMMLVVVVGTGVDSGVAVSAGGGVITSGVGSIVGSIVGTLFSLFQALTQIQEQTLQYALKFFAIVLTIFITASLLGGSLYQFTDRVMTEFPALVKK